MPHEPTPGFRHFQTTHWSLVGRAAGGENDAAQRQALGELLMRYMPALRSHLLVRKRLDPDRAEELLQNFFASKVVEQGLVGEARQERGKFRNFLLTALDRFQVSQIRYDKAQKRSAPSSTPLEEELGVAQRGQAPNETFDIAWARQLLAETIKRMREECTASGRPDVWGVFETRLLNPLLHHDEPLPYEELVKRFGLTSPAQASNVLITAKRMFARVLRSVIGEYEEDEEQIDAEIADLQNILARR